jgi:thioredoxin 1
MLRATFAAILLVAATAVAGCSRGDAAVAAAPPQAGAPVRPPATGRPRLVFFLNPNGMPCQMQDQVLRGMGAELAARADLVSYRTTDGNDLARFEQYGIRSLPALVLTDSTGVELRRATPGIQSEAQVRQLLGP